MRVLVIEDNTEIAGNISEYLSAQSHVVDYTAYGRHGMDMLEQNEYDVVVLDLMLPDIDGLTLCKKLRSEPDLGSVPILMLTARDTLEDKLIGFDAGTDDYLVKPFSLLELEARLNALVKRRSSAGQSRVLEYGDIRLNLDTNEAFRGNRKLSLAGAPRKILKTLLRAQGRTVSRTTLTQTIWGDDPPDADALSVHIHTLRITLHGENEKPVLLTVRGEGYRLLDPNEA